MGEEATDVVRTVAGRGTAGIDIRGSEFRCFVAPVDSLAAAESFVASIASQYPDASHVVSAWRVRDGDEVLRARSDDDGEPSGSAGKPTVNVLEQRELEGLVVATVRYFGGTELGVGGLARAYGRTVAAAIDDAGIIERAPIAQRSITTSYDDSGTVRGILESEAIEFEAAYDESVRFDCRIQTDRVTAVTDRLLSATNGRATIESE